MVIRVTKKQNSLYHFSLSNNGKTIISPIITVPLLPEQL